MKIFIVRYTEKAYADLNAIYDYFALEKKEPSIAKNLVEKLQKAIEDLSFMADSYHHFEIEPWFSKGVRYFSEGNYSIFYTINNDTATVMRIVYGARDLSKALSK